MLTMVEVVSVEKKDGITVTLGRKGGGEFRRICIKASDDEGNFDAIVLFEQLQKKKMDIYLGLNASIMSNFHLPHLISLAKQVKNWK